MGKNLVSDDEVREEELELDEDGEPIEGDTLHDRDPDDDEEEDDEGQDEYENDEFIVDVVDEAEEREDSDEERREKKKKRKKNKTEALTKMTMSSSGRMTSMYQSKKFKRLKKARRDLDEEQYGFCDDEFDGSMNGGANTEEKLKCTLFGDDDGQPLEDIPEDEEQIEEEGDGDMGEEDKMADFIVEEDDVPGDSVRYNLCTAWICRSLYTLILESWSNLFCRWKKMKNKKSGHAFDVSPSALKGAQDIFGDVDELLQLRKQRLDYSDQKERRLEDKFEPTVLSEKYMTVKDDEIRTIDIPERIQIFEESTGSPPMDEESNWMHKQLTSSAILLFGKERTDLSINKDDVLRFLDLTHVQNLNPYYHEERSCVQSDQEKVCKEREMAKKPFMLRMIVHPCFQNITANEAIESLSDKDPGENIIRPSSRGPSFLTLTLKLCDGVYAHKDIVEGGKEHKDITNLLCIGKTLKIGEDTFEDLDEVMDRYVDPLVSHLKAMLSYRRFRKGTKGEVDELLRIEKSEYPMRIVYCFGISHEHPGTFILTYIRTSNPHHEYIGLYPKGFKFRKRMFEDIDRLVAYFQKHIDDPQHESAPSIRSVAAMVPMRSPGADGSSGGSMGGWKGHSYDRGQSSTPGSRTGRGRDGHQSGAPRGGRGRGRGGSYNSNRGRNNGQDSSYDDTPKWDSGSSKKGDDGGWGSFPGAKVQNSPGTDAFPGGWGASGTESGGGSGSGWGASGTESGNGNGSGSGWGGSGGGSGWGASGTESGGGNGSGSGWGGGSGGWDQASGGTDNGGSGWGSAPKSSNSGGW